MNWENELYELGINFELDHNYFFFCMVKSGESRNTRHNDNVIFSDIIETLKEKFDNLISNGFTVGKSEEFVIKIDPSNYYHPEKNNNEVYKDLVSRIVNIKKDVDSIFNS